jgi:hypothetical protein
MPAVPLEWSDYIIRLLLELRKNLPENDPILLYFNS